MLRSELSGQKPIFNGLGQKSGATLFNFPAHFHMLEKGRQESHY